VETPESAKESPDIASPLSGECEYPVRNLEKDFILTEFRTFDEIEQKICRDMKSKKTHGGSKIKDHAKIEVVSIAINWAGRNGLNDRTEKDLSMKN
jgi:hypothetical protein